jgi:hypothetical protein
MSTWYARNWFASVRVFIILGLSFAIIRGQATELLSALRLNTWRLIRHACAGATVVAAVTGWIPVISYWMWLAFILAVGSSPVALGWLRRTTTSHQGQESDEQHEQIDQSSTEIVLPLSIDTFSTPEIVKMWRASVFDVRHGAIADRARTVRRRQSYLDVLEQRHPKEFDVWLHSGAWETGVMADFFPR